MPAGTTGNLSNPAGKIGTALGSTGSAYLTLADNATMSVGPNMSFTVACWVYVTTTGVQMGLVGRGSASPSLNGIEYLLWQYPPNFAFTVGSGSASVTAYSTFPLVANQWCLLIGWYDHVADLQYIQVNNGTPIQVANTLGSQDTTSPFRVGESLGLF